MENTELLRNVLFTVMMVFGFVRMARRFYKSRKGELPMPSRLTEDDVRRLVRKGDRPRAVRAWRELTGDDLRTARRAIERLDAEMKGNKAA